MGIFDDKTLGIPAISFKGLRRGTTIEGVLMPIAVLDPKTGEVVQDFKRQYDARNADGSPKTYPKSGDPIQGYQFLIQTDKRAWEFVSAKFEDTQQRDFPEVKDSGLRRWFAESAYAAKALRDTRQRLRSNPEVGGSFSLKITGLSSGTASDGSKWEAPDLTVNWGPATAEGRKLVEAFVASDDYVVPQAPKPAVADDNPWGDSEGEPAF